MLGLSVCDWVEATDANNLLDGVARAVVGVRVGAQDTAQVCFQPVFFRSFELVAALVDAVALYRSGDLDLNAHVEAGEGIVTTVETGCDFVGLVVGRVDERVDVGCKTGRGRGVCSANMVIYSELLQVAGQPGAASGGLGALRTDLLVDLTGCLTRCTRSGGPNSLSACKFSVRISTTEVESSSKILFVIVSCPFDRLVPARP